MCLPECDVSSLRNCTLLIVEDDPSTQDILKNIVSMKYPLVDLHIAENGEQGLTLFKDLKPEIVLTDLSLPEMHGLQMAAQIRKLAPQTDIIVLTASSDIQNILGCIGIGISSYVLKPIEFPRLFESINASLHRVQLARQLRAHHEALRASEERYRGLFSSLQGGVSLHEMVVGAPNLDFRFLDMNPAFEKMVAQDRDSLVGRSILEALPDLSEAVLRRMADVALTSSSTTIDHFCTKMDRSLEMHVYAPVTGQIAILYTDVTERRKLQEEREKNERLNSLGVLAGGIAHDFNNILTAIAGNISLAKLKLAAEHEASERLTDCENAVAKAAGLTRQLLTFARGGEPVRKSLSSPALIREAVSLFLSGTPCKAELQLPEDLWNIHADAGQIQQALNNLVLNAVQAMPNGGFIEVSAANVVLTAPESDDLSPGRYVKVTISDAGEGIHPDLLPRIFDPYVTTKPKGTGLGLSSVHSIIRRHQGAITVSSAPGAGTRFDMLLPAAGEEAQEHQVPEIRPDVSSGKEILLMDDEEPVRSVAARMLTALGYGVTVCSDGSEAVARYRERFERGEPFAAVVLDMTVPGGMGGKEAALQLRGIDPEATLIISSGYFSEALSEWESDAVVNGIVAKPYNVSQFAQELSRVFSAQAREGRIKAGDR